MANPNLEPIKTNPLLEARSRWTKWIDTLRTGRFPYALTAPEAKLVVTDPQFATLIPIPGDIRTQIRENQLWLTAIPTTTGWIFRATDPHHLIDRGSIAAVRRTYIRLIGYIQKAQSGITTTSEPDEDLARLRVTAADLFSSLPEGIQNELANYAPTVVFSTQTW